MEILGVRVDEVTFKQALDRAVKAVAERRQRPFFVVTPNPEQVVMAVDNKSFREALNSADLAIPDGIGLVIVSRLLNRKQEVRNPKRETISNLPGRVSGVDLFEKLVEAARDRNWRVMLVGGRGGVAAEAAIKIKMTNDKYQVKSKIQIKGVQGISDVKSPDKGEKRKLIEEINAYKPELLFVGFGAPWQELWVKRNLKKLKCKLVMVVGGAFDQIVDSSLRPPRFMERLALGWLYRLFRQPWRFKRQLRLIRFLGMLCFKG